MKTDRPIGALIRGMAIALVVLLSLTLIVNILRCEEAGTDPSERYKIRYNESETPVYDSETNLIAVVDDYGDPRGSQRKYSVRYEVTGDLIGKINGLSGVIGSWMVTRYDIFVIKGSAFQWWEVEPNILEALKSDVPE